MAVLAKLTLALILSLNLFTTNALPQTKPEVGLETKGNFRDIIDSTTINEDDIDNAHGRPKHRCVERHMCSEPNYGQGILIPKRSECDPDCFANEVCCDIRDIKVETTTWRTTATHSTTTTRRTTTSSSTATARVPITRGCGYRIIGGTHADFRSQNPNEASFGEYPWIITLLHRTNSTYFAAGTLIHPQVVLTAAHVVINKNPDAIIARAGEWNPNSGNKPLPFEDRLVRKYILHPESRADGSLINNFALLILASEMPITEHINVICLPPLRGFKPTGTSCQVTAWEKPTFILKTTNVAIVSHTKCERDYQHAKSSLHNFRLHASFVCAGGQMQHDTCIGDGGAALICPINGQPSNRYEQSGITSGGLECSRQLPALYANVPTVRSWIDEQVLAEGFDTAAYTP